MPTSPPDNKSQPQQTAVIVGAGPAGLTAALELQRRSNVRPIVLEKSNCVGGLARTINYKGNRIDIGGHRFFSKSNRVMQWWLDIMPLQSTDEGQRRITYQQATTTVTAPSSGPDPDQTDRVMLMRSRKSRIYFMRKFFAYPVRVNMQTLKNFGLVKTCKVGTSYVTASLLPVKPERTLEDFLTNRFGKELYLTFFKSYTEKVWGVPCDEISAAWGAQRIKGLSLWKAAYHFVQRALLGPGNNDISQKKTETSLIEQFLYPKLGPGQLWEYVAGEVTSNG
ncbi:MAG TPA: NAD(P)-binding protein, partial [Trichormus sp.]